MSNFLNKIPVSPITSFGNPSVPNGATFGTNFSILQTGGYMEVYSLSGLTYTIPPATTGIIEFSGNSIPIQLSKGSGSVFSPDVLTLNSDNISSGRRKLGMLVYVYETKKIYQYNIDNYDTLWNNATGATGPGGSTVVISDYGTTVKNNSAAGIALINAWTASTISGIGGYNDTNASWRVLSTGGSGGGAFTGGTVTGSTIFTDGLTANTISATTYLNLPIIPQDYLPLSGGTVTGATIFTNGLTANTISATTYQNLPVDIRVTGGTYSNGTSIFTNNTGGTFNVTGFTQGTVTSVELSMPSAFTVSNSPIISAGTISVTAAGVASQYIRGDGTLATLSTSIGGGSSVSYYLNGGVNQGVISGNTYYQMNKTPIIGSGADFTLTNTTGYIAEFITDINDPSLLSIPAGSWISNLFFSVSNNNGSPSFYLGLYKYNGGGFTLISTSSSSAEIITNGTSIDLYTTALSVPLTTLTTSDRLAIRVFVNTSGNRTVTLHTQDSHLAEIVTTFSNGLLTLNGLSSQIQYFQVGPSTGSTFSITSSGDTHTFNPSKDVFVTGGTYFDGTTTFTNNTGGTFSISGYFTGQTDNYITGGTFDHNTETLSLYNSTGGTITITGFTDLNVTGGTYSAGTITFTNNTGGTFNVSGLFTGSVLSDYLPLSGGTVYGPTIFSSGLTANTISATTYLNLPNTSFIRRHSFTNFDGSNSYDYNGYAPFGSSESANVWTITRLTINAFGSVTKGVATNVAWTDRVTVIYT
jgi:hypothetical protein